MKKILVTGSNGQLGSCLKIKSKEQDTLDFVFLDSKELDITSKSNIETVFAKTKFDYCINCAAYTAVDAAEDNPEIAHKVNVEGPKYLSEVCNIYDCTLIHISTDFVYSGESSIPYLETDLTSPICVYGETKLKGEREISMILNKFYIIRTSWLYSEYKNNFVKTMLKLASEKEVLSVVNDQIGTPTNANDLAEAIIKIINHKNKDYGLYHFSNLGDTTWFGFAKAIFELTDTSITLNSVDSKIFKTKAKRPKYSVLDKSKINKTFDLKILNWKQSLEKHIKINNL